MKSVVVRGRKDRDKPSQSFQSVLRALWRPNMTWSVCFTCHVTVYAVNWSEATEGVMGNGGVGLNTMKWYTCFDWRLVKSGRTVNRNQKGAACVYETIVWQTGQIQDGGGDFCRILHEHLYYHKKKNIVPCGNQTVSTKQGKNRNQAGKFWSIAC